MLGCGPLSDTEVAAAVKAGQTPICLLDNIQQFPEPFAETLLTEAATLASNIEPGTILARPDLGENALEIVAVKPAEGEAVNPWLTSYQLAGLLLLELGPGPIVNYPSRRYFLIYDVDKAIPLVKRGGRFALLSGRPDLVQALHATGKTLGGGVGPSADSPFKIGPPLAIGFALLGVVLLRGRKKR